MLLPRATTEVRSTKLLHEDVYVNPDWQRALNPCHPERSEGPL